MDRQQDGIDLLACSCMEWELLQFLLERSDDKLLWAIGELIGGMSDPVVALDALARLTDTGLIQRKGNDVMITRAALRFQQLLELPLRARWLRPAH
jgi:hypothetical protein